MFKEFKEFAMKGNIIDLAVGVVIGGAFGKIVTSLVNDIIMPVIGLLLGKLDFSNLFITLGDGNFKTIEEAKEAGVVTLNYGMFINNIIDFLIVSFSIFIVVKQINKFSKKRKDSIAETTKQCKYCCSQIPIKAIKCPKCTSTID